MKNSYSIYSHEESNQILSSIVNRELDETQNETNFPILNSILLSLKIAELYLTEGSVDDRIQKVKNVFDNINRGNEEMDYQSWKRLAVFFQIKYLVKTSALGNKDFSLKLLEIYKQDMNKQNKDFINYFYSVKLYEMIPKKAYDNIEEI